MGKKGARKRARQDNLEWVWVDTCCINKESSSELSEAINSMYQWYRKSAVCYTLLEDLDMHGNLCSEWPDRTEFRDDNFWCKNPKEGHLEKVFAASRWFQRGWTLQEMIAPTFALFFDCGWRILGSKRELCPLLSRVTGVDRMLLRDQLLVRDCSVADRMSWAANRETYRVEDTAYCLLGIFDVNLPLLYGEGGKAFIRLQEEIMRTQDDFTLFAWRTENSATFTDYCARAGLRALKFDPYYRSDILATHPSTFLRSKNLVTQHLPISSSSNAFSLGHRGLRVWIYLRESRVYPFQIAVLPVEKKHPRSRNRPPVSLCFYVTSVGAKGRLYRIMSHSIFECTQAGFSLDGSIERLRDVLFAQNLRAPSSIEIFSVEDLSTFEQDTIFTIMGLSTFITKKKFSSSWFDEHLPSQCTIQTSRQEMTGVIALAREHVSYFLFFGIDGSGNFSSVLFQCGSLFDRSVYPNHSLWEEIAAILLLNEPELLRAAQKAGIIESPPLMDERREFGTQDGPEFDLTLSVERANPRKHFSTDQ